VAISPSGCATERSGPRAVYVVQRGDTLWAIAQSHGVAVEEIARANGIEDVHRLAIGTRLRIPRRGRATPPRDAPAEPEWSKRPAPPAVLLASYSPDARQTAQRAAAAEGGLRFAWPLTGDVSSVFGYRDGRPHEGIDLVAPKGARVRAAERGTVIYSGDGLGAYGNVVILRHAGPYHTVYAHNRRNLVREGDPVPRGAVIAEVGDTGNASGEHLHFEIRRQRQPGDPLLYLP
jgi:lipoprotein NlpD